MPRNLTIKMPDGTTKQVNNIPDGVSDKDVYTKLNSQGTFSGQATESAGERFLIGLGYGLTRAGQGIKQIGLAAGEGLGLAEEGSVKDYTKKVSGERAFYEDTPVGKTGASKFGEVVGEILPAIAIPGGVAGGVAKRVATGALSGGAISATQFTEDEEILSGERGRNIAGGTVAGGAFPAFFSALKGGKQIIGDTLNELTEKGAQRQVKSIISQRDLDVPMQKIADDFGTWLSPAEATGRVDLAKFEQGLSINPVSDIGKDLATKLQARSGKISVAIDDVITDISQRNPEAAKIMSQGYEELKNTRITAKWMNENIFSNPVISKRWNKFKSSSDWQDEVTGKGINRNSAAAMDVFKRFLSEQEDKLYREGKKTVAGKIGAFRKGMVSYLDEQVPNYAVSRGMAQLKIMGDKLTRSLGRSGSKVRNEDGVFTSDAMSLFRTELKSDERFNALMRGLEKMPEAQTKLTQIRALLGAIENSPINKAFASSTEGGLKPSGGGVLGVAGAAAASLAKILRGDNAEYIVKYITDPRLKSSLFADLDPSTLSKVGLPALETIGKMQTRLTALGVTPEPNQPQQAQQ